MLNPRENPNQSSFVNSINFIIGKMNSNISPPPSAQTDKKGENVRRQKTSYVTHSENDSLNSCSSKDRFNARFPHINIEYYTRLTKQLLNELYPKYCPNCKIKLKIDVRNREKSIRCPKCYYQGSRVVYTPLHHLKLPLWTFSYLLVEAIQLHPQVLSAAAIQRKLGVSKSSSTNLKRRLQLFLKEFIPDIKGLMAEEVNTAFGDDFRLTKDADVDISSEIHQKPVISADTVALFSARERSNGHRSRYKHHGQTASIYLSDTVAKERGVYQIGTLCHTIAIKQGAVIFDSIPNQQQKTIQPLLGFLPEHSPTFTDDGYPWLKRLNHNARSINHSARAKDGKRYVWAKDRWSKNGVHNQVAEGFQRVIKHSFLSGYGYIKPKYSQLYLDEWCALKGLKVYGLGRILNSRVGKGCGDSGGCICKTGSRKDAYFRLKIEENLYVPPTPDERGHANHSRTRKQIKSKKLKELLKENQYYELKQAVWDYLYFWDDADRRRKRKETEYNSYAHRLWKFLSHEKPYLLSTVAKASSMSHKQLLRIVRIWAKLGVAEVVEHRKKERSNVNYYVRKLTPVLPDVLYTYRLEELEDLSGEWDNIEVIKPPKKERKGKYGSTLSERKQKLKEAGYEV